MHTGNRKDDEILDQEFQHFLKKITSKMVSLIMENTKNDSLKGNGQTDSTMFRIMLMLQTNMWEFIVKQINYQNYHFVVHIPNLMAQGGRVSIIICFLIKN